MRPGIDFAARRFVHTARLHADEAVFDEVEAADAMLAAKVVERCKQRRGRHRLTVECDPVAALEIDRDIFGRVGCILGIHRPRIDIVRGLFPRILEHLAFRGRVQQVRVGREGAFAALVLGHRNLVLLGEVDERGATRQIPFAPRRDHLDVGVERITGQFEAHLVIALARRAVRHRVGARFARDFDQPLRNQRPRDRRAEQIIALVTRVGAHHREN